MMGKEKAKLTRAESVLRQLAFEIVAGNHPSGVRLDEVVQSQRLKVSRTPLREALRQLTAVGLVESMPHCGVVVSKGGREGLLRVLEEIETIGVRWLCEQKTVIPASPDGLIWPILHQHCGNPVLSGVARTLWQPLMVMCDPLTPWRGHRGLEDKERALRLAIQDGEAEQAESLVRRHVQVFVELVMSAVQLEP